MSDPLIELTVEEPGWQTVLPDLADIAERAAMGALFGAGVSSNGFVISLLACSDDRIQSLNLDFRGKPAPTNVLSWPAYDLAPEQPGDLPIPPPTKQPNRPFESPNLLGDVAIALQTCVDEAKIARIPLKNHVTHLILHGCLHLLGFDHQTDTDAAAMEGIETRTLTGMGIPDPYC